MAKRKDLKEVSYQFVDLYNYGFSSRDIAEFYGIAKTSVLNHLKKSDVCLEANLTKYDNKTQDEIISLYIKGYNRSEISDKLRISYCTVTRKLKDLINVNSKFEHLEQYIFNDYETGLSISNISEKYNINRSSVHGILHRKNATIRTLEETGRKYKINDDYFKSSMTNKKLKQFAVFIKYGSIYIDEVGYRARIRTSKHKGHLIDLAIENIVPSGYATFVTDGTLNYEIRSRSFCESLQNLGMSVNTDINLNLIKNNLDEEDYKVFIKEYEKL